MKCFQIYSLMLVIVFHGACKQKPIVPPRDNTDMGYSEVRLKEAETDTVPWSMVRNLRLARNGDILIASFLGVFRYDGKSFTNLTGKIISPRFSSFWDVMEDRHGNLWLGTRDSGAYFFPSASIGAEGKSLSIQHPGYKHFTKENGLASDLSMHLYEDRAGNVWIGSSKYDGKTFQHFSTKDGYPSNKIRLLLEDKSGRLWFGAQLEDLFVYDGKTFTVLKDTNGNTFNNVWSVIEDKKGNFWFGASNGLWRYDGHSFTRVSKSRLYALLEDKDGNIWTTGEKNSEVWAISRYDADSLYNPRPAYTVIKEGGRMGFIRMLEANDGSIWYGANDGVYRYDGKQVWDFKGRVGIK